MKAKINHGNRGKKIEDLCKQLGLEYPADYFEYIEESYENGNKSQVIELFNAMKHDQQVTFLCEYARLNTELFIIKNL